MISALPKGLLETYERILRRVSLLGTADIAEQVFRWTGAVRRPLSLSELREALAVQPGDTSLRRDQHINGFEHMVSWCGNLVTLDEESGAVQFAHATVKQYLQSVAALNRFCCAPAGGDNDARVGAVCMTYLCLSDFERQLVKPLKVDVAVNPAAVATATLAASGASVLAKPLRKVAMLRRGPRKANMDSLASLLEARSAVNSLPLAEQFVFLRYASQHWIAHTRNLTENAEACSQFLRLVLDDGHFAGLASILQSPPEDRKLLLRYILDFSYKALLKALLTRRRKLLDSYVRGLFLEFCNQGLVDIAKMLLESKMLAETDIIEPLEAAAAAAQYDTLNMLIEAAANDEVLNGYLALALKAAVKNGQVGVVRRLLASGADVAMAVAATVGQHDTDMFELLLDAGMSSMAGRALCLTGNSNTPGVLRVCDWNFPEGQALELVAGDDILGFIGQLLRAGVRLDLPDRFTSGRTALETTAESGLLELAVYLIRGGADVNSAPAAIGGRTALKAAASACQLEMVNLLLDAGADVNAKPAIGLGYTALQAAACTGNAALIVRLLDAGADVNAAPAENGGRTAL